MSSLDKTTPNDQCNIGAQLAAIAITRAKAIEAERKASRDKLKADLKKRVIELAGWRQKKVSGDSTSM